MDQQEVTPSGSTGSSGSFVWRWLEDRYRVSEVLAFARHKKVPMGAHSAVWYYLGGLSLFFFVMQLISGLLVLMYYKVGVETSHASMKHLVTQVPFGWLVRAAHCWASHLMIACVLAHMFSVYFAKAYRKPRELTWLTGMALLGMTLGFGFSGYLLPWNELSYFATAVGTESVKSVPLVGQWLLEVMRGGPEVTGDTLFRFLAFHVSLLPLIGFALVGFHLVLIQRQGMADPLPHAAGEPPPKTKGMPFFPSFALRDMLLWIVAVNVVALLSVYLPNGLGIPGIEWELGKQADPLASAEPGIKPEWYFLWVYQLLRETPPHIMGMEGPQACVLFSGLLGGIWTILPFLDRRASRGEPSPAFTDLGVGTILFLLYLTLKAWDLSDMLAASATIGLGVATTVGRILYRRRPHLEFTVAAVLIPVIDGILGQGYMLALGISCALVVAATIFNVMKGKRVSTAAAALLVVAGMTVLAPQASAEDFEPNAELKELLDGAAEDAKVHFDLQPHAIKELFNSAAEDELLSSQEQFDAILSLGLMPQGLELVLKDNCILCHTNPDLADDDILFALHREADDPYHHLTLDSLEGDVHMKRGLSCSGCHGGSPEDFEMSDEIMERWPNRATRRVDRSWIPRFCGNCHSDPALMRRFNPALPVDQLIKYRESRHGEVILRDENPNHHAAQCVSCHGVHGIRPPQDPSSLTNPFRIAYTCGKCHSDPEVMAGSHSSRDGSELPTGQLDEWLKSIHGVARMEHEDAGAPACNNCHGNHAALPPSVATSTSVCRQCHVGNSELFDGSPHKAVFDENGWAECSTCHGHHTVTRPTDEFLVPDHPQNRCQKCHAEHGKPECDETAAHFSQVIRDLADRRSAIVEKLEQAEHLGMDTEDLHFSLADIDEALVTTRSRIHSFDRGQVDEASGRGIEAAERLDRAAQARVDEFTFRRRGLLLSTLIVTLMAVLLYFKIRQVDQQIGYEP